MCCYSFLLSHRYCWYHNKQVAVECKHRGNSFHWGWLVCARKKPSRNIPEHVPLQRILLVWSRLLYVFVIQHVFVHLATKWLMVWAFISVDVSLCYLVYTISVSLADHQCLLYRMLHKSESSNHWNANARWDMPGNWLVSPRESVTKCLFCDMVFMN